MRATGDELGLPSPRHSTAGVSAENSSHDDFIISTEHDKGGYVRNAGRSGGAAATDEKIGRTIPPAAAARAASQELPAAEAASCRS